MLWVIVVLCLIGIYKGWNAFNGCIKADALVPAANMLIMTILFLITALMSIWVMKEYNIDKKFIINQEYYGEY